MLTIYKAFRIFIPRHLPLLNSLNVLEALSWKTASSSMIFQGFGTSITISSKEMDIFSFPTFPKYEWEVAFVTKGTKGLELNYLG